MLKPVKMQKLRIVAVRSIVTELLAKLHQVGAVEIRRFASPEFSVGRTIPVHEQISRELHRLRGLRSMLGITQRPAPNEMPLEKVLAEAEKIRIDEKVKAIHDKLDSLESQQSSFEGRLADAKDLSFFKNVDFSALPLAHVHFYVGKVSTPKLPELRKALPGAKMSARFRKNDSVIIAMVKKDEGEISAADLALGKAGFDPMDIEGFSTPSRTIQELSVEIGKTKDEIAKVRNTFSDLAKDYGEKLLALSGALDLWADRAFATKDMGFGADAVMLEGWVKEEDYDKLVSQLAYTFHKKVYVEKIPGGKDVSPTVLHNPESTTQFQFLVEMFSLPKPKEIDPTLVLFITVPIIYGMMLGDVAYGIISFFIASWMANKFKSGLAHEVARIWKFSAISGMIFGVFFDEWMGMSHYQFLEVLAAWGLLNLHSMGITEPLYHGFHRALQLNLLIGLSIILGLIHLALGFLLGAINEWHHNRKHAIGKLFWIVLEIGGFIAVLSLMFNMLSPEAGTIGLIILGISVVAIAYTEGMMGIIELPGILGNALSYARIAAVGLAGVMLAELINHSFIPKPEQGLVILLMLPLLLILHVLNTGLAMVECIVQGGRLNLIEFYTKFFHGGGKPFAPFSVQKGEIK